MASKRGLTIGETLAAIREQRMAGELYEPRDDHPGDVIRGDLTPEASILRGSMVADRSKQPLESVDSVAYLRRPIGEEAPRRPSVVIR